MEACARVFTTMVHRYGLHGHSTVTLDVIYTRMRLPSLARASARIERLSFSCVCVDGIGGPVRL